MASRTNLPLRSLALVTAVCALGFGLAVPAGAAPTDSTASGTRDLNVLNEQYNLTRVRLDRASAEVAATQGRLAAAHDRAKDVQALVRSRSARLYQSATGSSIAAVMNVQSVNEFGRRTEYVAAAAKPDEKMLQTLSRTMKSLDTQEQALTAARDKLRAEAESMAAARQEAHGRSRRRGRQGARAAGRWCRTSRHTPFDDGLELGHGRPRAGNHHHGAARRSRPHADTNADTVDTAVDFGSGSADEPEPAGGIGPWRDRGRIRPGAARQALRLRHVRSEHVRLLRPHHGRVARRRA